jgi:uncharacterized protein (TIGR02099 family)
VIIATVLICLAVLVGVARLLLPLAPDYQDEIRRFASEATGFDVQFGQITATWPLLGPEVRFTDVRIATLKDRHPVLDAGELGVGVNLWQLVVERRLRPGRISVSNASVNVEHLAGGAWLINSVPLEDLLRRPQSESLPRLDLQLENIELAYADASRLEPRVDLRIEQLNLELGPTLIGVDGEIEGEGGLGRAIGVTGTLPAAFVQPAAPDGVTSGPAVARSLAWEVQVKGEDLDVARLLRILANEPVPLMSGRGNIDLRAGFAGLQPRNVSAELALGPTIWEGVSTAENNYRRLEFQAGWQALSDGWEATLGRFAVERGNKASPVSSGAIRYLGRAGAPGTVTASADNVRLQDFWPMIWSVGSTGLRRDLLPERVDGMVRRFKLTASLPAGEPPAYQVEAGLEGLGITMPGEGWAVRGVTGSVRADQDGGQIALKSAAGLVQLPMLFRTAIHTTQATGEIGWKYSERGIEVIADDFRVATEDAAGRSRVHVIFPREGSVFVDLAAQFTASSAPAAVNYLPLQKFKPGVVKWLDQAIVAGAVPRAELLWQGPLRGFPYEKGDGRFRVEVSLADLVLNYSPDWPRLQDASGTVIFDRASMNSVQNKGSIGGVPFQDIEIGVANLAHDAELDVAATDTVQFGQLLNFLRQSPVAAVLGPALETVTGSGNVSTGINLQMPILNPRGYRLTGNFGLAGARLGLRNVDFGVTELQGVVRLDANRLTADNLAARFLDEPVNIQLRAARADEAGLYQVAEIQGSTPAAKLAAAFALPYGERLDGSLAWDATVQIPERNAGRPVSIRVASDLKGLASNIPVPLTKAAREREALDLEVRLPERGLLQLDGKVERGMSWALQFVRGASGTGWRLERGALRSGLPGARLPEEAGLEIGGTFDTLRFEDWFPGGNSAGRQPAGGELIRHIDVDTGTFAIFGRVFRDTRIEAERAAGEWRVAVQGPAADGAITVPAGDAADVPILLDMKRLWLLESEAGAGGGGSDPRNVPAIRASVGDFALNEMRLGRLTADIAQRGDGIVVEPLELASPTFEISGNVTWVVENGDVGKQRSEARMQLKSTNVARTLRALGYKKVAEGEKATVTADLFWPGGPSDDFLNDAGGRVVLDMDKGRFLAVDPGGGRIVGLLSIAMLPRRLGLDFSDVVDKGLAFDRVKGEFRLDEGNAFTCNFGLEGPATDIGIVGRVSFRDRSYDQVAVVRPHVTDVLAVGGFVGGPVVGGTVLLISQLFRKPLSSLGESYYRVSGVWDQPVIDKVQKSDVDITPFRDCERYLAEALKELPPEAELSR